jgi:hypothetical protein
LASKFVSLAVALVLAGTTLTTHLIEEKALPSPAPPRTEIYISTTGTASITIVGSGP